MKNWESVALFAFFVIISGGTIAVISAFPRPVSKDWVEVLQSLLTPAIGLSAFSLGILNYSLQVRKRNDGLFERRLDFCKRFESACLELRQQEDTYEKHNGPHEPQGREEFFEYWSIEAGFLFGEAVARKVRRLKDNMPVGFDGDTAYPLPGLAAPFKEKLTL